MIFEGRNEVRYAWGRFGWTRNSGRVWHGGLDVVGLDDTVVRMPFYKGKSITGVVTRARIVTNHADATWEWGYYLCVRLDNAQTSDAVNYLYFCHCDKLLAAVGTRVKSGDALAVMGMSGNAALANPAYPHLHFEVRATATGRGLDPTAYAEVDNAVGVYGAKEAELRLLRIGPVSGGDAARLAELAAKLGVACVSEGVKE